MPSCCPPLRSGALCCTPLSWTLLSTAQDKKKDMTKTRQDKEIARVPDPHPPLPSPVLPYLCWSCCSSSVAVVIGSVGIAGASYYCDSPFGSPLLPLDLIAIRAHLPAGPERLIFYASGGAHGTAKFGQVFVQREHVSARPSCHQPHPPGVLDQRGLAVRHLPQESSQKGAGQRRSFLARSSSALLRARSLPQAQPTVSVRTGGCTHSSPSESFISCVGSISVLRSPFCLVGFFSAARLPVLLPSWHTRLSHRGTDHPMLRPYSAWDRQFTT
jgi:hypothetical protein